MAGYPQETPFRKLIARNTAANWASYLLAGLTTLVLTPFVVRTLGPSGYGVWVLLAQLAAWSTLLELGVQAALAKHVAQARGLGDTRMLASFVGSAAVFYLLVALAVLGVAAGMAPHLASWFNLGSTDTREAASAFLILGGSTALTILSLVFSATLKGCLRFDVLALVGMVSHLVRAMAVVVALGLGAGIVGLAWASLTSSCIVLTGAAYFARREIGPSGRMPLHVSGEALRRLLGFGLFSMISLSGWYLAYASDPVIAGRLLSPGEVAQLGLGLSVTAMISGVIGAFAQSFMPVASSLQAGGAPERLRSAYLLGTRWCLLLSLPCLALALGWGPDLLEVWVGRELGAPAGSLLGLLLLAQLPTLANSVGFQIGLGIGLHRHAALLSLAEGIVKVIVAATLAARFGTSGIVLGSLVASMACNGFAWPALLRVKLDVTIGDTIRVAVLPALWPMLASLAVGSLAGLILSSRVPLFPPAIAALTYGVVMLWRSRDDLRSARLGWRGESQTDRGGTGSARV